MERITRRVPMVNPMAKIRPDTITTTATTKEAFLQTLAAIPRGSRIAYHTGDLAFARYYNREYTAEQKREAQEVGRFANFVYGMYEKGQICLVQRRLSKPFGHEYLGVKR